MKKYLFLFSFLAVSHADASMIDHGDDHGLSHASWAALSTATREAHAEMENAACLFQGLAIKNAPETEDNRTQSEMTREQRSPSTHHMRRPKAAPKRPHQQVHSAGAAPAAQQRFYTVIVGGAQSQRAIAKGVLVLKQIRPSA